MSGMYVKKMSGLRAVSADTWHIPRDFVDKMAMLQQIHYFHPLFGHAAVCQKTKVGHAS